MNKEDKEQWIKIIVWVGKQKKLEVKKLIPAEQAQVLLTDIEYNLSESGQEEMKSLKENLHA